MKNCHIVDRTTGICFQNNDPELAQNMSSCKGFIERNKSRTWNDRQNLYLFLEFNKNADNCTVT